MTAYCGSSWVKWLTFALLACQVLSAPKISATEGDIKQIFSETKRDVSGVGLPAVSLLKTPLFNPFLPYAPFIPGKPVYYPPFLPVSSSDLLLNRLAKSASTTAAATKPTFNASDPSLMSAYFKAKKDEFLTKLFEKLATVTPAPSVAKRAAFSDSAPETTAPIIDSSFFLKKKFEFLDTLFKTLNITATTANATDALNTTDPTQPPTPKPTIVSPDFWFPFAKIPKPTKAPKPTKPPKAKKILKDALDTVLLQSLLIDMGVDPKDASLNKRAAVAPAFSKKSKSKKVKSDDDVSGIFETDPSLCSAKAPVCLDKLFKILNKTDEKDFVNMYKPKASKSKFVPKPTEPSEPDYPTKIETLLELIIKSLNPTDYPTEKPEKAGKKSKFGKKIKRSTFLDELLHRVTPAPATTTPETTLPPEDIILPEDSDADSDCDVFQFLKNCCGCGGKCLEEIKTGKSARSLIFKPFGSGYWIPQYLYATKMGMYLDKLMDSINNAAVNDIETESSDVVKRSVDSFPGSSELPSKDIALGLIIAELTELKNNLVDAFADGIEAQKNATVTPKPYGPPGKSFKKPFWGPKAAPTIDPIAPIQKRIDIINDVFDKLTKVEKTLMFTSEPEYDPKLLTNLTEILQMSKNVKAKPTPASENPDSPEYFLSKTLEYIKNNFGKGKDSSD